MRYIFITRLKKLASAFLVVLICSCSPQKEWQLQNVSGHLPDLQFSFVDDNGKRVTENNFHGDIVLLYFGFAGCSAQCPVVLQHLAGIMAQLGRDADHIRILFVSIDPRHDTPQRLHRFVGMFDKEHIVGLTDGDVEDQARRYRAAYRPNSLVHGNAIYIFDTHGKVKLLAADNAGSRALIHDLRQLVHS